MFDDHLVRKQSCHIGFYQSGYSIILVKKMEISSLFVVWQTRPENNVWWLYSTNAISDFGKKKLEISFLFVFGEERPRNNVW